MKCKKARLLFHKHLDNELDVSQEEGLRQHLAVCETCARESADLQTTESLLKTLEPRVMPESLARKLETRLVSDSEIRPLRERRFLLNRRILVPITTAAAILLICGGWLLLNKPPSVVRPDSTTPPEVSRITKEKTEQAVESQAKSRAGIAGRSEGQVEERQKEALLKSLLKSIKSMEEVQALTTYLKGKQDFLRHWPTEELTEEDRKTIDQLKTTVYTLVHLLAGLYQNPNEWEKTLQIDTVTITGTKTTITKLLVDTFKNSEEPPPNPNAIKEGGYDYRDSSIKRLILNPALAGIPEIVSLAMEVFEEGEKDYFLKSAAIGVIGVSAKMGNQKALDFLLDLYNTADKALALRGFYYCKDNDTIVEFLLDKIKAAAADDPRYSGNHRIIQYLSTSTKVDKVADVLLDVISDEVERTRIVTLGKCNCSQHMWSLAEIFKYHYNLLKSDRKDIDISEVEKTMERIILILNRAYVEGQLDAGISPQYLKKVMEDSSKSDEVREAAERVWLGITWGERARQAREERRARQSSLENLIEELGDGSLDTREKATQKILEMGDEAIPALEDALQKDYPPPIVSIELKFRIRQILQKLQNPGADDEKMPDPGSGSIERK